MVAAAHTAPEETAWLWPCNLQAWSCWCDVQSQWRVGMSGATGMDYAGVRAYLDELGYSADERKDIFTGIRAAERATLDAWAQKSKAEKQHQPPPPG